jgi:PAS domain-containing protein
MKKLILGHIGRWFGEELRRETAMRSISADRSSMDDTRRELAMFASDMMGAQSYVGQFERRSGNLDQRRLFRDLLEETPLPYMVIDPRPGLHIVDVNDAYAAATLTTRAQAAAGRLFDVFPDNPDDPGADGVSNLYESLQRAAQSGEPHAMMIQRYDVRDAHGQFVQRYWRPINTPIFDEAGKLVYLLHFAGELPADFVPGAGPRRACLAPRPEDC